MTNSISWHFQLSRDTARADHDVVFQKGIVLLELCSGASISIGRDALNSGACGVKDKSEALFVFLKFISSVVPTINYDFTMEIEF